METRGTDTNNDNWPDIPLRFEFEDSNSVIQFPLGFCPGSMLNVSNPMIDYRCRGHWGFVFKEWQTITKAYPKSAKNLNRATKTLDIDIYDQDGVRVDVYGMKIDIQFVIGRIKYKDPFATEFKGEKKDLH